MKEEGLSDPSAQAGTGAFWGDLSSTSEPQFLHGKMRMILNLTVC